MPQPPKPRYGTITPRTIVAPLAALTMAALLYVYSRTSIRAAKLNAQRHREADGGQLSWYREGLRRHGAIDKIEDKGNFKEALLGKGAESTERAVQNQGRSKSVGEEKLDKILGKGGDKET